MGKILCHVSLVALISSFSVDAEKAGGVSLNSPVGLWKNIDDKKKTARSIIEIKILPDGTLTGKILKLLNRSPDEDPDPNCTKCTGPEKNKRVVGLRILKDLSPDGDEWSGGEILDPKNGKWYKCYIEVQDGGKKLKVRGYIGFSLLGRTQYWYRVKSLQDY